MAPAQDQSVQDQPVQVQPVQDQDGAPTRRRPPAVRRRMLLDAARTVIAERGLHATTLRDVAAAGGVAVGTVTYHFSGIAELLVQVLESEMASYSAPLMRASEQTSTGRDGLLLLLDGLLADSDRAVEHWKLWLDFWALAAHREQYARWQHRVYVDLHALVARLLERGRNDGSLPVTDPEQAAVEIVALLDGLVVQCYLPGARLTAVRGRELLRRHLDRLTG
jgi:AcrR family transcriptional regulator